jgi:hypothetical protein
MFGTMRKEFVDSGHHLRRDRLEAVIEAAREVTGCSG